MENKILVLLPYDSLTIDEVVPHFMEKYDISLNISIAKFMQLKYNDFTASYMITTNFLEAGDYDNALTFGLCKKENSTFTHIIAYKQYVISTQEDIFKGNKTYEELLNKCYLAEDATEDYNTLEELTTRINELTQKKEG